MRKRLLVDVKIRDVGHFLQRAKEVYDITDASEMPFDDVVEEIVDIILTSNTQYDDLSLDVLSCKTDRRR